MRKILIHGLLWVVFFLMWDRLLYFYVSNLQNRLYFLALDVALIVPAFYLIYRYLMPDYFRHKNLLRLLLSGILLVLVLAGVYAWLMGQFLNYSLMPIRFNFSWTYLDLQYNRLFIATLGVIGGASVALIADRLAVGKKVSQLEKEQAAAELTYLKAQLNPHFLFNSLNSIYTQLEFNVKGAKDTLNLLADLLRYQLYDCNAERISLEKEIAYLKSYIGLQQLRKDNCRIEIKSDGFVEGLYIPPLLLIPFVENAFKHLSDGDDNWICVEMKTNGKNFDFCCSNTFMPQERSSSGIGLENVKKRLALHYGNNHMLSIFVENNVFEVKLSLGLSYA